MLHYRGYSDLGSLSFSNVVRDALEFNVVEGNQDFATFLDVNGVPLLLFEKEMRIFDGYFSKVDNQ